MPAFSLHFDPWVTSLAVSAFHVLLAGGISLHIVLTKSDVRAAIGWVGLVWLAPVVGSALYVMFGINRLRREAGRRRRGRELPADDESPRKASDLDGEPAIPAAIAEEFRPLARLVGALNHARLEGGNAIDLLVGGDEAYPAMLDAIDAANRSVALATYIFNHGQVADRFLDALGRAVERGVEVRVLVDSVGARYSRPPILRALRRRRIPVARFLPSLAWRHPYVNLRNHRKLLIVDGHVGFCGGLNIQDACLLALDPPHPIRDMHFRVRGPVVGQMMQAMAFDWKFTTHEELTGPSWFPPLAAMGEMPARGIADGPDEDFESLVITLLGALSQARRSIRIVTPYFLPDATLIDALRVAALRGVQVDIVLPGQGNLRFVQWAATAQLSQVIRWGCRVHLSPSPFDHSKLFVVDDAWSLIGSANWDPRSLRLNFEYVIECYSPEFAARLGAVIDARIAAAKLLPLSALRARPIAIKVRDGLVRLAQPYL